MDLGRGEVVAFGDAEGGVVFAEDGVDLFGEQGFVAELEGDGRGVFGLKCWEWRGSGEEVGVGLEVGRELEEQQAEAARLAHGCERSR